MLAFRPFDTNNTVQQSLLCLSPPTKKCEKSPGKDPIDADMLYRSASKDSERCSGFKFDLQSVTNSDNMRASKPLSNVLQPT